METNQETNYRMRLRFRLAKSFASEELEKSILIDGRQVIIKSRTRGEALSEAKWVIAGANGFVNEDEARAFGKRLRHAIHFAALVDRNGVDCGRDLATCSYSDELKTAVYKNTGEKLRDDIHGIDVFVNDGTAAFLSIQMTGVVRAQVDPFLSDLRQFYPWTEKVTPKVERILIMLHSVLTNQEPVAQIVLAISTVEQLGQDQQLSSGQKELLSKLASMALASDDVSLDEAHEIADAVSKIHKLGLRQGVMRLLSATDLRHLKNEWDAIYGERSKLVHGLAPVPGVDYAPLADRTVNLCVRVLHRLMQVEIGAAEIDQVSLHN